MIIGGYNVRSLANTEKKLFTNISFGISDYAKGRLGILFDDKTSGKIPDNKPQDLYDKPKTFDNKAQRINNHKGLIVPLLVLLGVLSGGIYRQGKDSGNKEAQERTAIVLKEIQNAKEIEIFDKKDGGAPEISIWRGDIKITYDINNNQKIFTTPLGTKLECKIKE